MVHKKRHQPAQVMFYCPFCKEQTNHVVGDDEVHCTQCGSMRVRSAPRHATVAPPKQPEVVRPKLM